MSPHFLFAIMMKTFRIVILSRINVEEYDASARLMRTTRDGEMASK